MNWFVLSTVDNTGDELDSIQILTGHEGNGGKLLSRGETQPWPTGLGE